MRVGNASGPAADLVRSAEEAARRARGKVLRYCAANKLNRLGTLTYRGAGCHDPHVLRADVASFFKALRVLIGGVSYAYAWANRGVDGLRDAMPRSSATFAVTVCGAVLIVGGIILTNVFDHRFVRFVVRVDSVLRRGVGGSVVMRDRSHRHVGHRDDPARHRKRFDPRWAGSVREGTPRCGLPGGWLPRWRQSASSQRRLLALRVATYDEPVLRHGWTAVRDTSGVATVGLCVTVVVVAACHPARRHSSNAAG